MHDLGIISACQQSLVFLQGTYISSVMEKKYMLYEKILLGSESQSAS